ncbi:glutathione S-transferase kappa 1-like, partial [Saccoglossus kowalevskii]
MALLVKKTVELFYDVLSPFAWIGFEILCRYKYKWNIDLKLKPFYLGAIVSRVENKPPCRNKKLYSRIDLHRLSDYYQIPFNQPNDIGNIVMVKGKSTKLYCYYCGGV